MPSKIGTLLELTIKEVERVLYFEMYIVIEPGSRPTISVNSYPRKSILKREKNTDLTLLPA